MIPLPPRKLLRISSGTDVVSWEAVERSMKAILLFSIRLMNIYLFKYDVHIDRIVPQKNVPTEATNRHHEY